MRLAPKAVVKADDEVVVPLKPTGPVGSKTDGLAVVEGILTLLAELVPPGTEAVAAAVGAAGAEH
jgi:hypothetical protein